jgi:hypothetical protein
MDVEDVAAGHQTKLRWNERSAWIWSDEEKHEALVTAETFAAVQKQIASHAHLPRSRKAPIGRRVYPLSGLVKCGICGRRMQGSWSHDTARYRCKFPAEYALANKIDHPKTAYVRESSITDELDAWLAQLFDPTNLQTTIAAMAACGGADAALEARAEAARRKLEDCDSRLARYRSALDSGADPLVVTAWVAEVQGDRFRAEAELASCAESRPIGVDEVRELIQGLSDVPRALSEADPADKASLYSEIGVSVIYHPEERKVVAEVTGNPCTNLRVGGGT